ncbi:hypothetical protein [Terasakiella pusilla]|uniref:hypothetical protein n=1 Tax=Terasakiella pusilla TaxID=64973 RepID=UPI003AA92A3B
MKRTFLNLLITAILISTVHFSAQAGSMGDYAISEETYTRAFDNRFQGEETLGWGEELSTAWSRLGAANACGIQYDKKVALAKLNQMNNVGDIAHEMNGIYSNELLAKKFNGFCTDARKTDIKAFIANFLE